MDNEARSYIKQYVQRETTAKEAKENAERHKYYLVTKCLSNIFQAIHHETENGKMYLFWRVEVIHENVELAEITMIIDFLKEEGYDVTPCYNSDPLETNPIALTIKWE